MSKTIQAFIYLHQIQKGFDGLAEELEQLLKTPVCIEKCGKCCEINTPQWTAIEAMNAVSVLAGNGKLDEALKRAEYWLTQKDEAISYEGMLAGCFVPSKIKEEHWKISRAQCPMLDDDKRCVIHEARPLACRAGGVTVEYFGFCPRPQGRGEPATSRMYLKCPDLKAEIANFKEEARRIDPKFVIYSFVPTMLFRAAREVKFYEMVHDNKIASAKIVGTDLDTTLLWQEQKDAVAKGVTPDLVAMKSK